LRWNTNKIMDTNTLFIAGQGLTAFMVAAFGLYFQHQQKRLQQNELLFKLYEKRSEAYIALAEFCSKVTSKGDAPLGDCFTLLRDGLKNEFLFGSEIRNLIEDFYKKGVDLRMYEVQLGPESSLSTDERVRISKKRSDLLLEIASSFKQNREKFKPYLNILIKSS